ncbi:hypothetical protein [Streptomyces mesophilus]|uniref:hypothetical protein n=1 Tax=Streptomyces mesophilus TaxID=1775132 RepID=UPI00332BB6AA
MSTPQGPSATSTGDNSLSIGQNIGNVIVSLMAGPGAWNWPPFCVVVAVGTYAYTRTPEASTQLALVHALFLTALVLTVARTLIAPARKQARAMVTALALVLTALGFLRVEELRESGDVDVTDSTRITPAEPLETGEIFTVTAPGEPHRAWLRLTLKVSDGAPGVQTCTPDTTLDVRLLGPGNTTTPDVRSGEPVELDLTRKATTFQAEVTVRTPQGCEMNVSVADAVLHD